MHFLTLIVYAVTKKEEMESPDGSDSDEVAGEKENEDLWNDGEGDAALKKGRGGAANSWGMSRNE